MTFADILAMKAQIEGAKIGCLREYQNSLDDSVYALLDEEIKRLRIPGYRILKAKIDHSSGGAFRFKGLARSTDAIKSMFGFNVFWLEEGQFISDSSLKILTPTLRESESELWISANPMSIMDPFSKRFIVPYQKDLDKYGYYEDDMHYIVKINYRDNPWFPDVLEAERLNDKLMLPKALYDHIWEGDFNDSIENALILAEWFDACIDADEVLGFKPLGINYSAHDPSDIGPDAKGYAFRHGSVVLDVQEKRTGDINEGCDWAIDLAIRHNSDAFTWDCDGMGVGLSRQIAKAFDGKHTILSMFKGSNKPDNPDAIVEAVESVMQQKTNKEAFKNKRAQKYFDLRNRVIKTYNAVEHGIYSDPDEMISIRSDIEIISQVRSELCRMPIKPNNNGLFELYTKEDMKSKFKFNSPNLADPIMMLMDTPKTGLLNYSYVPPPLKTQGVKPGRLKAVR